MARPGTQLLTRSEFREAVFARDNNTCVVCGDPAENAHHIVERRLFPDGGYYLDNGASLCDKNGTGCHWLAEQTVISCEELRARAHIETIVLPPHLDSDENYTKWGDLILADGRRAPGELFDDPSVRAALAVGDKLRLYTPFIKYPRTPHLPWSQGRSPDDIGLADVSAFEGREVVVTAKLDGENTTWTRDRMYARSPDGPPHRSQSFVRAQHAAVAGELPDRWRFCGENMYAEHSIHYPELPGYFLLFSIWNEKNECLSWDETETWAQLLGVPTVPVLYRGPWYEPAVKAQETQAVFGAAEAEGIVVRVAEEFGYADFRKSVAKYVRADHVSTDQHWRSRRLVPNGLSLGRV